MLGYTLLVNGAVREYVVSLESKKRQHLNKKLGFLQNGKWDTGLVVKKLRGTAHTVFEARLNVRDRILFTLERPPNGDRTTNTRIHVWEIVEHDDVNRVARRIRPENAPFLDFKPEHEKKLPKFDASKLRADFFLSSLDQTGTSAGPDAGPQHWFKMPRPSGTAKLSLLPEQEELLQREPPLLLSGIAGSGKTTIAVHFLFRHQIPEPQGALFLTYSHSLKQFSKRIYRGLVRDTNVADAEAAVRFATLDEVLKEIWSDAGHARQQTLIGLKDFREIIRRLPLAARYDPELVWEEIRSIIKGVGMPVSPRRVGELAERFMDGRATRGERVELAKYVAQLDDLGLVTELNTACRTHTIFNSPQDFAASLRDGDTAHYHEQLFLLGKVRRLVDEQADRLGQPLLTLAEYTALGRKRAPNFPYDRKEIYRIAEYYQKELNEQKRYDEIDFTRAALEYLEQHEDQLRYDLVVCDEVQDFTNLQLALLFRLARDPRRILIAGDFAQIINPTAFRWQEVRQHFFERGLPVLDVTNLSVNSRNVDNIVRLANGLLHLKDRSVGSSSVHITHHSTFRGRPPLLFEGLTEDALLSRLRSSHAGQVVLVRTERECERLRSKLRPEMVFTINEAKGLEFDSVLLWRVPVAHDIWRRIVIGHEVPRGGQLRIRHELSLLYVAVTRARNALVIWDGQETSPIWSIDELAKNLYRSSDAAAFDNTWRCVSTPRQWEEIGDYFFKGKHFAYAEDCYRHSGVVDKENSARERRLGHKPASLPGPDPVGGQDTDKNGMKSGMLDRWKEDCEFDKLARFYRDRNEADKAGRYFALAGNHVQAAVQFRQAGLLDFAAKEFEIAGNHQEAARLYLELGNIDARLRCLLNCGAYFDATRIYEQRGELEVAIECYRKHLEGTPKLRRYWDGQSERVLPDCAELHIAVRIAACGHLDHAAQIFENAGDHIRAARLMTLKDNVKNLNDVANYLTSYLKSSPQGLSDRIAALQREADSLFDANDYERALAYSLALGKVKRPIDNIARNLTRKFFNTGRHRDALAYCFFLDFGDCAKAYLRRQSKLNFSADDVIFLLQITPQALWKRSQRVLIPVDEIQNIKKDGDVIDVVISDDCLENVGDDGVKYVLLRIISLWLKGDVTETQEKRISEVLGRVLPPDILRSCHIDETLSDVIIDLRLYEHIMVIMTARFQLMADGDDHRYFVNRLRKAASDRGTPELVLCTKAHDRQEFKRTCEELLSSYRNCNDGIQVDSILRLRDRYHRLMDEESG